MPAEKILSPDILMDQIVVTAGGDPNLSEYSNGTLFVPDVTQPALDAAVAAYDPVIADDKQKDKEFNQALLQKQLRFIRDVTFNHENRIRALEGQPARTKAEYTAILKTIYKGLL